MKSKRGPIRVLCGVLAVLLAAVTLMGIAARLLPSGLSTLPYVPIIVASTPWFALSAAVALLLALIGRRTLTAVMMVLCLLLQIYWQAPFFTGAFAKSENQSGSSSVASSDSGTASMRVMTCNVYKGKADAEQIVALVRDQGVRVLALQETTADFLDRLESAGIAKYLPYSKTASADGVYGNGIWSATPLTNPVKDEVFSSASQMPAGTVSVESTSLRFVSVHTTSPVPGYWKQWGRSLDELAAMQQKSGSRYVFMGDFNATYDHALFREFLGTRFTDAARQAGRGLTFTWPSDRAGVPDAYAIDHVVLDENMKASDLQVLKVAGSDHAALLVTIRA